MSLGSILKEKLKSAFNTDKMGVNVSREPPVYQYGDRVTQDKRVIALRRTRNRQLDLVEKEQLEASINRFERRKASRDFLGDSILGGGKGFNKRKPSVKSKSCGFLGKKKRGGF